MTEHAAAAASRLPARYIACPECDLLHTDVALERGHTARCIRCDAVLYRRPSSELDHTIAYAIAAAVAFVVANTFPIMELELQGFRSSATLIGAARRMHEQGMSFIGALVFATVVVAPGILLATVLYLLLPLRLKIVVPGFRYLLRLLHRLSPWAMAEVMMLGVLVSLVKLGNVASVTPGIGLWSFGATMILLTAIATGASDRALWSLYETEVAARPKDAQAWV